MRSFDVRAMDDDGATTLRLRGPFRVEDAQALRDELRRATSTIEPSRITPDRERDLVAQTEHPHAKEVGGSDSAECARRDSPEPSSAAA